jgi:DNA ligase (NAD+)
MVKNELIKDPADVFYLTTKQLTGLPTWGIKKADNLIKEISLKKKVKFPKFINALSIPGIGLSTSRLLAIHFKTLVNLQNAEIKALTTIPSIGESMANGIINFFKEGVNKKLIQKMLDAGVTIINTEK